MKGRISKNRREEGPPFAQRRSFFCDKLYLFWWMNRDSIVPKDKRRRSIDDVTFLNRELLMVESLAGVEPWYSLRIAGNGADHDYIYNHTPGPDWLKGLNADAGFYNAGPTELLGWNGVLTIWQLYEPLAKAGKEFDPNRYPVSTDAMMNGLIADTGISSENVWDFFTNLDRIMTGNGSVDFLRPHLKKKEEDLNPFGEIAAWVLAGLGVFLFIDHQNNNSTNNTNS